MRRYVTSLTIALGCAVLLQGTTSAQTSESKTKTKAENGTAVTYTGCMQTGTETRTYVLQNVVPIATTQTTGTSGTMTSTTYALIPEGKIELQQHVGHKVEVSGVLVPAGKGETKFESKTKSKDSKIETKGEIERGPMPQLKVISVRPLAESCS